MKFKFDGLKVMVPRFTTGKEEVTLKQVHFPNGRVAVYGFFYDEHGCIETFGKLSINIPTIELADDETIIKNYAENELFAKACFKTGAFEDTGRRVKTGFVEVPIWKLL